MKIRSQHVAIVKLLDTLKNEGGNYATLKRETGIADNTIREYIMAFRAYADPPLVYVDRWEQDSRGCYSIPFFRWNPTLVPRPDAPRPRPLVFRRDTRILGVGQFHPANNLEIWHERIPR